MGSEVTDAQVLELEFLASSLSCDSAAEAVRAALTEVLAARHRRCGACKWWEILDDDPTQGECERMGCQVGATWFCADHTAKERA